MNMSQPNTSLKAIIFSAACLLASGVAVADELKVGETSGQIPLTTGVPFVHVMHEGKSVKVQRVQDPGFELSGYWAKTVRKCPPFCLKGMTAADGVTTVGEVEVFAFMEGPMRNGTGMLIDARTPAWNRKGTIPGSVNVPFLVFSKEADSIEVLDTLEMFGASQRNGSDESFFDRTLEKLGINENPYKTETWDFTHAKDLMLWCNGAHCGQSPKAIQGLIQLGYPREKLFYYRGGMQSWQLWGLTTVTPES